jgi:N-acetylneuraminic acid mutarotase
MNRPLTLTLILLTLTTTYTIVNAPVFTTFAMENQSENSWTSKAPVPYETRFGLAVADEKIYAIGGYATQGGYLFSNKTQMYDPKTNVWTTLAPMPTPRVDFAIAVVQDKIYVIGGTSSSHAIPGPNFTSYHMDGVTGTTEVYDPQTNTWTTKAAMPTPRNYLQANVVDNKIYLIGGQHQQKLEYPPTEHSSNLTEVYDPATDTWTTVTPIPTTVWGYASAVLADKIYIISGWSTQDPLTSQVQIFDPETDTWSTGLPIPTPVTLAGAAATTGEQAPKRIYIIGGCPKANTQGQGGINTTQIYNPQTNTWTNGAEMPTRRRGLAVANINDTLYAIGGANLSITYANEQYTPIGYGTPDPTPTQNPTPSPTIPETTPTAALSVITITAVVLLLLRRRNPSQ